jgi:hypothetical protein
MSSVVQASHRFLFTVALLGAILGLSGCEDIKVKNGEVPDQYIEAVGEYTGIYHGFMDGFPGLLEIRYVGNRPEVIYRDLRGTDLVRPGCQSVIGKLETLRLGKKNDEETRLHEAGFEFDPGLCWTEISGRQLKLAFSKSGNWNYVDVTLVKAERWEQRCSGGVSGGSRGGSSTHVECRHEKVQVLLKGRFRR